MLILVFKISKSSFVINLSIYLIFTNTIYDSLLITKITKNKTCSIVNLYKLYLNIREAKSKVKNARYF